VDPLSPIPPSSQAMPSRRVPPVDRLERISRERDRPSRDAEQRRRRALEQPPRRDEEDTDDEQGHHVDVRV
jgi:hypothetical protein